MKRTLRNLKITSQGGALKKRLVDIFSEQARWCAGFKFLTMRTEWLHIFLVL